MTAWDKHVGNQCSRASPAHHRTKTAGRGLDSPFRKRRFSGSPASSSGASSSKSPCALFSIPESATFSDADEVDVRQGEILENYEQSKKPRTVLEGEKKNEEGHDDDKDEKKNEEQQMKDEEKKNAEKAGEKAAYKEAASLGLPL